VLSVDENTQIQALERTQHPLPLREGRARRPTANDFLRFMKHVARRHPRQELHIVLDNLSTHGTAEVKGWLAKNPRVHFHDTPTSASWLNPVDGVFGILGKQSLGVAHFPSKVALREHIDAYIAYWSDDPTPFIWTKPAASIIRSRKRMLDRISHAVQHRTARQDF
jgi:transposase